MANTYIVSGSQFKPYTFDEMIKPALMYKQAYDAVEEGLNNLEILASGIEDKLTDSDADKIYKDKYVDFNNQINNVADLLLSGDLNKAKKEANKLKTIYAKELNPINEAYTKKLEYQKMIQQLKAKEGVIVAPTTLSTSDFLNGNTPDLPDYYSLKDIEDSAKESSIASAKRLHSFSGWTPEHGGSLISRIEKTGFNEAEFNQAYLDFLDFNKIINDDNISQQRKNNAIIFANIYTSEMQKRNTEGFAGSDVEKESQAVLNGMRKGLIGSTDVKTIQNPFFDLDSINDSTDGIYNNIDIKKYPVKTNKDNYSLGNTNTVISNILNEYFNVENGLVTTTKNKKFEGIETKSYWDPYSVAQSIGEWFDEDRGAVGGEYVSYDAVKDGIKELQARGYARFLDDKGEEIQINTANDLRKLKTLEWHTYKINNDIKKGVLKLDGDEILDKIPLNHIEIPITNDSDKEQLLTNFRISNIPKLYEVEYDKVSNKYKTNGSSIEVNEDNFKKFNGFRVASLDGSVMLNIGGKQYALPIEMYEEHKDLMGTILNNETVIANNLWDISKIDEKTKKAYGEGTLPEDKKQKLDELYALEFATLKARDSNIQTLISNILSSVPSYSFKQH